MDTLYMWVRNLICCLCMVELLCHLVRSGEYRRYLRFFGGLVILLLMLGPVADFFSIGTSFEEALQLAFAKEEAYELQMSQEALAGLQSRKISEAFRAELERQMKAIAQAHGQQSSSVEITLAEEDGGAVKITEVSVWLLYGVEENAVHVSVKE